MIVYLVLTVNEDSDQYLAISCHNNPDEVSRVNDIISNLFHNLFYQFNSLLLLYLDPFIVEEILRERSYTNLEVFEIEKWRKVHYLKSPPKI